jgi:hypothetical protein
VLSHPGAAVAGASLIMVNGASCLHWGWRTVWREGAWHWWWGWWLQGESMLHSFRSFTGQGVEVMVVVAVMLGEVGVINRAVVPIVGVPLR